MSNIKKNLFCKRFPNLYDHGGSVYSEYGIWSDFSGARNAHTYRIPHIFYSKGEKHGVNLRLIPFVGWVRIYLSASSLPNRGIKHSVLYDHILDVEYWHFAAVLQLKIILNRRLYCRVATANLVCRVLLMASFICLSNFCTAYKCRSLRFFVPMYTSFPSNLSCM